MKLKRPRLSPDIDADLAVDVIGRNTGALTEVSTPVQYSFEFNGMHNRTAKGDELTLSVSSTARRTSIKYRLKRDSIYHILPEYLFHPLDRYADTDGDKEEFLKKRADQQKIEEDAKQYFYPYDRILNDLRVRFQSHLNESVLDNEAFIIDFLTEGDGVNKENPFIRRFLPFILCLREHRGSAALVNLALKAALGSGLAEAHRRPEEVAVAIDPASCHISLEGSTDTLFCGNHLIDWVEMISLRYQTPISSAADIGRISKDLEEFSLFFKSRFLTDNQEITITFGDYTKVPVLCDNPSEGSLFLNYNTQLIAS